MPPSSCTIRSSFSRSCSKSGLKSIQHNALVNNTVICCNHAQNITKGQTRTVSYLFAAHTSAANIRIDENRHFCIDVHMDFRPCSESLGHKVSSTVVHINPQDHDLSIRYCYPFRNKATHRPAWHYLHFLAFFCTSKLLLLHQFACFQLRLVHRLPLGDVLMGV